MKHWICVLRSKAREKSRCLQEEGFHTDMNFDTTHHRRDHDGGCGHAGAELREAHRPLRNWAIWGKFGMRDNHKRHAFISNLLEIPMSNDLGSGSRWHCEHGRIFLLRSASG